MEQYDFLIYTDDYTIVSPQTFSLPPSDSGTQRCVAFSTEDDDIGEGTEQFELYFENLDSDFANAIDPKTICVNIIDNDGMSVCSGNDFIHV